MGFAFLLYDELCSDYTPFRLKILKPREGSGLSWVVQGVKTERGEMTVPSGFRTSVCPTSLRDGCLSGGDPTEARAGAGAGWRLSQFFSHLSGSVLLLQAGLQLPDRRSMRAESELLWCMRRLQSADSEPLLSSPSGCSFCHLGNFTLSLKQFCIPHFWCWE